MEEITGYGSFPFSHRAEVVVMITWLTPAGWRHELNGRAAKKSLDVDGGAGTSISKKLGLVWWQNEEPVL